MSLDTPQGRLQRISNLVILGAVALLLILLPWHEFIVALRPPLGAWKEAVLGIALATALLTRRDALLASPLFLPLLAFSQVYLFSAAIHDQSLMAGRPVLMAMLAGLVASVVPARDVPRLVRWLVFMGLVAVAYGLAGHVAFREVVNDPRMYRNMRVPGYPDQASALMLLVLPYYMPNNLGGNHLAGPFLNPDYFGIWMAAILALVLTQALRDPGRTRVWVLAGIPVLTAIAWTFSRSAAVALVCALLALGWRADRRVLLLLPLCALLSLAFISPHELTRFGDPLHNEWGRLAAVHRGVETLASGAILGNGPENAEAFDCQYARLASQLGWAGVGCLLWLAAVLLGTARKPTQDPLVAGLFAAVVGLAAGGVGTEVLEVPQTAWTLWILFGLLVARSAPHHTRDNDIGVELSGPQCSEIL